MEDQDRSIKRRKVFCLFTYLLDGPPFPSDEKFSFGQRFFCNQISLGPLGDHITMFLLEIESADASNYLL